MEKSVYSAPVLKVVGFIRDVVVMSTPQEVGVDGTEQWWN